jgi:DNA-directed RNA polymerase subunit F
MIKMILEDIDDEITYENKNTLSYIEQYSKNQINKDPETLTEVRLKIFFEDCVEIQTFNNNKDLMIACKVLSMFDANWEYMI